MWYESARTLWQEVTDVAKQQMDVKTAAAQAEKVEESLDRLRLFLKRHVERLESEQFDLGKALTLLEKCNTSHALLLALSASEQQDHRSRKGKIETCMGGVKELLMGDAWMMDLENFFNALFSESLKLVFQDRDCELVKRCILRGWFQPSRFISWLSKFMD